MTAFQVFLVILGLIIIGISYILSEKVIQSKELENWKKLNIMSSRNLSEDELVEAKEQINMMMKEELDKAIFNTEDRLSQISNEKIIAVTEYSDQILDKINQNHTEVVFLYNMLNEKEEALKKMVKIKEDRKKISEPTLTRSDHSIIQSKQSNDGLSNIETADANDQKIKNKQILKLYSEGKSIVEIAKILEIGQGEIKLVIELSRQKKA